MKGLFGAFAGREAKATDISSYTWSAIMGGPSSKSGVSVNIDTALRVSAVLACARVLAEGVAQLPLKVYREAEDGSRSPAKDHPVYKLLYARPNDWMTSFELRETLMLHLVLTGNAFAFINRVGAEVRELIPLPPGRVVVRQGSDYELTYTINDALGVIGTFDRSQIMHLRGPSWNGYLGLDAIFQAREAIGLAIATEETHARLHSNGARPGGILTTDKTLTDVSRARLRAAFTDANGGVAQAFKTAVLDDGMKWQPLSMTGVDSQHLETRRYQVEEICRSLRVFPQMVGYSDKTATFASAEAFFQAHVTYSLQPWLERWEESIWRDLLDDDVSLSAKFSVQSFLRGNTAQRAAFYTSGVVNGWFTRNEVRGWEELNPLPGLDAPLTPLNMGSGTIAAAPADDGAGNADQGAATIGDA